MATKVASYRLSTETVDWLKSYAGVRGVTQNAILEAAVQSFRADTEAGVPDLPKPEVRAIPTVRRARDLVSQASIDAMARQRKLNEAKERSK